MYYLWLKWPTYSKCLGNANDIFQLIHEVKPHFPNGGTRNCHIEILDEENRIFGVGYFDERNTVRILTAGGVQTIF